MTAVFHSNCICKNPKPKRNFPQDIHKQQLARPAILKWNTRVKWNPNVWSVLGIFEKNPFQFQTKRIQGGKKMTTIFREFFHVYNRVSDMDLRLKKQLNHLKAKVERIWATCTTTKTMAATGNKIRNAHVLRFAIALRSIPDLMKIPFFRSYGPQQLMMVELSSGTSDASSEIE